MDVLAYVKKYKAFIFLLTIFSILSTIVSIAVPYLNGQFIDLLIISADSGQVIRFALVIIAIGLFGVVVSYVNNMTVVKFTNRSGFDVISDTVGHVQKIPYDTFVSKFNPAYLIQRINTDSNVLVSFVISNIISVFLQAGSFIVVLYVIYTINIQIFLLTLAFLPIYMLCYVMLRKPLFIKNIALKENQNQFSKILFEQVNRIQEIKADASFSKSTESENRGFVKYFASLLDFSRLSYLFTSLDGIIVVFFQAIVLLVGGIQIVNGNMTLGEFTIVSTYFAMLLSSIKYYFNLGKNYQEYNASNARMNEILSIEKENNGDIKPDNIYTIALDKVTYTYPNQTVSIMKDVSAEFKKGEITSIMGKNGSGKTTMINVILGIFQNLQEGIVKYDSIDISDIDLYSVRNGNVATILQGNNPPDATVYEYLSDHFDLDKEGIANMVKIMGLEDMFFTKNFDLSLFWDVKMDTMSGGERQKVMILKAMGRNRDVLVLDEPSTGLDAPSVSSLLWYLERTKNKRICIIVTHDQRFEKISDNIIYFDKVE